MNYAVAKVALRLRAEPKFRLHTSIPVSKKQSEEYF